MHLNKFVAFCVDANPLHLYRYLINDIKRAIQAGARLIAGKKNENCDNHQRTGNSHRNRRARAAALRAV
jgi:hypothetical protein